MAIDKLIPQYLNKDEDERLVKSFEMSDALNVRVSHGDEGNQGIVKNVEGTLVVPVRSSADAIPSSGTNRVIGSVSSEAGRCIYFFLYNSGGAHGIYQYSSVDDNYRKVYEDSVLNFSERGFVKGDVVINQFQEHLLYFTDNRNEPRKINATKALLGNYNSTLTAGTDSEKNKFLTACKAPPQVPITFVFQNNDEITANNLKESCFQFAYQYIYDDGEVSALSPYSALSVSRTHTAFNSAALLYLSSFNNEINLTIQNAAGPVEKIRVFARRNNSGSWFMIEELDNIQPPTDTVLTQELIFRNDGAYTYLSEEEANKPFDSVPHRAAAQCLTEGRLVYGNYTEGFDNIPTDVYQYPVYNPESVLGGEYDFLVDGEDAVNSHPSGQYAYYDGNLMSYGNDWAEAYFAPFNGVLQASAIPLSFAGNNLGGFVSALPTQNFIGEVGNDVGAVDLHFDVDLSDFPIGGFPANMNAVVDFNASLSADSVGIVARGGDSNTIDVTCTTYANGASTHTQTMGCMSVANKNGAISNLKLNSDINFHRQFSIGAAATIEQFRTAVIEGVMGDNNSGLNTFVSVSPGTTSSSHSGDAYGNSLSSNEDEGNHIHLGGMTTVLGSAADTYGDTWPITVNNKNQLFVALSGELKFRIWAATNITPTKIRFFVKMVGVDLSADRVLMPMMPVSSNQFIDTNYHSLVAENYNGFGQLYEATEYNVLINGNNTNDLSPPKTIEDYGIGSDGMSALLFNYKATGTVDVFSERDNVQTFKAGATHDLGVVYYDDRNRASGVQRLGSVGVEHFGRPARGARNGPTEIDLRLLHTPPAWADRWAPVYTKNTTYDSILQVSVAEACLGKTTTYSDILSPQATAEDRDRPVLESIEGGINGQLFLSLRTLEGKANSYKEFKGGQIDYKFQEGDVLRVLRHAGPSGGVSRPLHEFVITSYNYYADDDKNPIKLSVDSTNDEGVVMKDENNFRRTGWFLTVRDNSIPNFSRSDVSVGTDYFSQKCVVEIYRPKKNQEEQVYYEMGKSYPIETVSGQRTHGGDRSNSASPTAFNITIDGALSFTTSQRLYLGDRMTTTASGSGYVFVSGIAPLAQGLYRYSIDGSNPFAQGQIGTGVSSNTIATTVGSSNGVFPGVVTLTEGDMYMRIREQMVNQETTFIPLTGTSLTYDPTRASNARYEKVIVEDHRVSDFFDSAALSLGRPHIETPEQKEISRTSAITYSEKFVSDSSRLNLSSFNPSLFPFKDYNSNNGAITFLVDGGEAFFTLQENKVSSTPVGRTLIESAGEGQLVTSTTVLGKETYFAGEFGPGTNPESVVNRFGRIYFCDISRGRVVQITNKGIDLISDKKMESFFETLFSDALVQSSIPKLPCGIDPENSELVVTLEGNNRKDVIFGSTTVGSGVVAPSNPGIAGAEVQGNITPSNNLLSWDSEEYPWDSAHISADANEPEWQNVGAAVVYADLLLENGSILLDPVHVGTEDTVMADVLTSDGGYRGTAQLSCKDGTLNFCTYVISIGASVVVDATEAVTFGDDVACSKDTIAYSTSKEFWTSRYSFNPEMYANLHNRFFSYENGQIWRHNTNPLRGRFYDTYYDSTLDVISKKNPSMVKAYNALSLESNDTWAAVVSNTSQNATITEAMYEEREGMQYAKIPRDSSNPPLTASTSKNQSHRVVLGVVDSVVGTTDGTIKFTTRISDLPFNISDTLYLLAATETDTTRLVSGVVDRKTIQVSNTSGIAAGDVVMAVSSNSINGDKIRDYYLGISLTSDSTAHAELYAVNVDYAASPLHNEQVN